MRHAQLIEHTRDDEIDEVATVCGSV